jgi:hypothetical protein
VAELAKVCGPGVLISNAAGGYPAKQGVSWMKPKNRPEWGLPVL